MRLFVSLVRSRSASVTVVGLMLVGCGGGAISPDKARTMPVALAAGGTLTGEQLDKWLVATKQSPVRAEASALISAWINDALLIDAFRKSTPLDDPATFDSVIMETAARTVVGQYFAARDSQMPAVTERQIDSVLDIDQARVFQQIVFRVKGKVDTASVAALKRRAEAVKAKLDKGADFTALVKENSDDSASRAHNGFVPAVTAGELPPQLASLFTLAPNALSPIVVGQNAFFILRRATRTESRTGVKQWLAPRLARHADSLFVDSIAHAKRIVVPTDARLRTRTMAHEPVSLVDGPPFATWQGGSLTPAAVRNGTFVLNPVDRYGLTDAPDTVVNQFLTGLARRDILLPIVAKEPLPTAAIRATYLPPYRRVLDSLKAVVGRLPSSLSAADAATAQIDSVLAGRAPFLPLPGALAEVLRARSPVTVDQAVFDAVVRGAIPRWQMQHKDDSATSTRPATPPIQPAPAGAPVPGGAKKP